MMTMDFCREFSSCTCGDKRVSLYHAECTYLPLELLHHSHVDSEWVLLRRYCHRCVIDVSDGPGKVRYRLCRHLALASDRSGELAGIILNVLEVRLDLSAKLLEVLDDGRLDGPSEGRVGIGYQASLVADGVEDVLLG